MSKTSETTAAFLNAGGEMSTYIRSIDWSRTPLGSIDGWPQSLRTATGIMLGARSATAIGWGPDLILLYNDTWRARSGEKHPHALGQPARTAYAEIWETIGPLMASVMAGCGGLEVQDQMIAPRSGEGTEEVWFDYSFSPIPCAGGTVGGVLWVATEATERVQVERQLRQSEERFQAAVKSSALVLAQTDRELRYRWIANPHPDFLPAHVLGMRDDELDDSQGTRHLVALKQRVLDSGIGIREEISFARSDGVYVYDTTIEPLCNDAGDIVGVSTAAIDISERKKAEAELSSERRLLQTIYDTIPVMLTIYDPRIEQVVINKHLERVTGWTAEDTAQTHIMELAYPDPAYRQELTEYMKSLQPGFRDVRMATKGGGMVETSWANVRLPDGRQVGIGIDISARKQAEEGLRHYAERLRLLREVDEAILSARSAAEVAQAVVERVPRLLPCLRASVTLYDLERHQLSLLAVYSGSGQRDLDGEWRATADPAWEEMLERFRRGDAYLVDDLQALAPSSPLMAQLQVEGARAHISEPIRIQGQFIGTLNLSLAEPGPLSPEAREVVRELALQLTVGLEQARLFEEVQRYTGELEQLVQQRTAALQASQARFRTVFDEAPIGIALADLEGNLTATNPALQRMLGYDGAALGGMCFFDLVLGSKAGFEGLGEELAIGQRKEQVSELRYLRQSQETGEAIVTLSPLGAEVGDSSMVLILIEDITERKRTQEALIQAERLSAMGRMAASLAHEINNPLQAVVGCLGLAMELQQEGEDTRRYLDVALEEVGRAATMVRRMRDLGLRDDSRRERVAVGELLERVLALTHNQAQAHGVEVVWEKAEGLPVLPMVRERVQQVFLNLVLNAIDAMPEGGTLLVRASHTEEPPGVQVAFADTGPGIEPEEAEQIFEAFHSTKERGMGLGLFVSRNIVQDHGGWIDVHSGAGKGATFVVWLPSEGPMAAAQI